MNEQPGDALTEGFGYWLCRLEREVHAASNRGFAPLGVSTPEWVALALISRGFETPAALADELDIDRAAVTRTLGLLQAKGLIRTVPHPTDGRSTLLKLTCDGTRLLPKLAAASLATDRTFLNALASEDSDALLRLIRQVAVRCPKSPSGAGKLDC